MSTSAVMTLGNTFSVMVLGEEAGGAMIRLIQGQTGPAWSLTFKNADNSAFDLTGVTYNSGTLFDTQAVAAGVGLLAVGAFATTTAASGTGTFTPNTADVAVPGTFVFEAKITKGGLVHYFRCPVVILERYTT